MPRGRWVRSPKASKQKIPSAVQTRTERRLLKYAETHLAGRYTRMEIRFRGEFCYVDAFEEPKLPDDFPPKDWGETREEMIERMTYDILYIENISLLLDMKIIIYTVLVMVEGRGK